MSVGLLGGAEQAVLGLASNWVANKRRVVVFGNFSVDPTMWPPTGNTDSTGNTGNTDSDTDSSSHGDSSGDSSLCGCNGEVGSAKGAMFQGVQFCHVDEFNGSIRYAGTMVLWRAFNAFYTPLLNSNIQVRHFQHYCCRIYLYNTLLYIFHLFLYIFIHFIHFYTCFI